MVKQWLSTPAITRHASNGSHVTFQSGSRSTLSSGMNYKSAIWALSVYGKYFYGPRNHAAHAKIFRNFVSNSLRNFVMAL